ncbi:MAG: right-handed parallel beta-helix repeat-containing protein [Thermoplasmatales archaeon]|nr:right-handed parallel beta-helix repeat-containing protein [Thermoplasmatales archaeon]
MKRRIKIVAISLIAFILAELAMVTGVYAQEIELEPQEYRIIVDKNGNGDYKTIQDAVNNAEPGSIIYVKNGEYKEIIDIKKQITLIGEDKDYTLINPISDKNKYAVRLGAPGLILKGLSIKNGAPGLYTSAIRVTSSNTEIRDCNIYETPVGIVVWTSNNIIDNCNFWACTDEGIALIGTSYSDCSNNKITNCVFRENCDGIELQFSSSNTITDCTIYDNSHTGIDAISSSNDNNIISNCEIYNNEVHGIYLSSSSENQIIDCSIYDNDDGNIIMRGNSENNQIISNSDSNSEDSEVSFGDRIFNFLSIISNPIVKRLISIMSSFISF